LALYKQCEGFSPPEKEIAVSKEILKWCALAAAVVAAFLLGSPGFVVNARAGVEDFGVGMEAA